MLLLNPINEELLATFSRAGSVQGTSPSPLSPSPEENGTRFFGPVDTRFSLLVPGSLLARAGVRSKRVPRPRPVGCGGLFLRKKKKEMGIMLGFHAAAIHATMLDKAAPPSLPPQHD